MLAYMYFTGLLESVGDLAVSHINSTTVLISWSPPFTLEGVPILGYNVTITTSEENDTVQVAGDTTMLYYSIQDDFTVTVIAINAVGPGDKASHLHSKRFLSTRSLTTDNMYRVSYVGGVQFT